MAEVWGAVVALAFAAIHLLAGRLRFLDVTPRSIWLSAAGGVSVAYVFLHLLPELHQGQHVLEHAGWPLPGGGEQGIYLLALLGLTSFYGLERLAASSRRARDDGGAGATAPPVFALHVGAFALYNAVIGYLLVHGERDNLLLYACAMGLHFLVNDRGLREHHQARYHRSGRWVLALAVAAGWAAGLATELPQPLLQMLVALLAGAVVLNVLKEELPEQRESRFWAFLAGAAGYGLLLLLL